MTSVFWEMRSMVASTGKNNGWEFTVGYRHALPNGFSWDINGNISKYSNEITKLPETVAAKGTYGGNGVKSVVGHAMFSQVGYIYDGIFKSQDEIDNHAIQEGAGLGRIRYKDLNGDGRITEASHGVLISACSTRTGI